MEDKMTKIVILASGRGSNAEAILKSVRDGILQNTCQVLAVVTNNPEAGVLGIATEFGVRTFVLTSVGKRKATYNAQLLALLTGLEPDFVILAGYMKIIPQKIVDSFPDRIVNIHPADTAEHQGLGGYEWAFRNGLTTTRITVHLVDYGMDTGRVLGKCEVDLNGCGTLEEVERRGLTWEHRFFSEVLLGLFRDKQRG